MQRLKDKLEYSSKVVLINGIGGIGKTVLATAYIHERAESYDHLVWINRGEDLIDSIALNEYLADSLNLPFEQEEELDVRFRRVLRRLHQLQGKNLMVIDNVQEQVAQKTIYNHLSGLPNWSIVLTSRLGLEGFDTVRLDIIDPEDAKSLFRTYFNGPTTGNELEELLEEIGYHTLTIELLAKLLDKLNNLISIRELTKYLQNKQLDNPSLQEKIQTNHSEEERSIFLHLMKAFELIKLSEREKWLLKQFVALPLEQYSVLEVSDFVQEEPLKLNRVLNSLVKKGWLSYFENKTFSIHSLVKQVLEYQLTIEYKDVNKLVKSLNTKLVWVRVKAEFPCQIG
jgi:hypothetical protein